MVGGALLLLLLGDNSVRESVVTEVNAVGVVGAAVTVAVVGDVPLGTEVSLVALGSGTVAILLGMDEGDSLVVNDVAIAALVVATVGAVVVTVGSGVESVVNETVTHSPGTPAQKTGTKAGH